MQSPPEITLVDSHRVWCDGSGDIRSGPGFYPAALGHPRVWMQIDEKGYVECGYCDRRFVLKDGPGHRSIHEASEGDLQDRGDRNEA